MKQRRPCYWWLKCRPTFDSRWLSCCIRSSLTRYTRFGISTVQCPTFWSGKYWLELIQLNLLKNQYSNSFSLPIGGHIVTSWNAEISVEEILPPLETPGVASFRLIWPSWLSKNCLLLYLNFIPLLSVSVRVFLCFIHVLCHVCVCVIVFYADQVSNKDTYKRPQTHAYLHLYYAALADYSDVTEWHQSVIQVSGDIGAASSRPVKRVWQR